MTHRILDRVQETTTATGAAALALAGPVTRMRSFVAAGFADGDTFWGLIEHTTAAEAELALCTYKSAGNYITRATPPLWSTTGSTVNFSAGTKTISLVAPATKTPLADNNGVFIFTGPISVQGVREALPQTPSAITAGVLNLDLLTSTSFPIANNANVTTLNILNATAGMALSFSVLLTADGTQRTWTWPASVVWPFGAPTLTSTNGKRDLFSFMSFDGGTTWIAFTAAQGF
ncbi:hypothetical protein [Nitrobacter sp.]|uniref:hypothetical protein n=1 Tax=Nitrobacter sp. TaxID=29420 RepID=UPI0029CAAD3B|nr:hypothetical protein [Nitrobacter sp.]